MMAARHRARTWALLALAQATEQQAMTAERTTTMTTDLDLTAAIEAVARELAVNELPDSHTLDDRLRSVELWRRRPYEAEQLLEAALPHIREALAQQIETARGEEYVWVSYSNGMARARDIVRGSTEE